MADRTSIRTLQESLDRVAQLLGPTVARLGTFLATALNHASESAWDGPDRAAAADGLHVDRSRRWSRTYRDPRFDTYDARARRAPRSSSANETRDAGPSS